MHPLLEALAHGNAGDAAAAAVADPPLIAVLLDGMRCEDEIVRARAGDAAQQAARERPELVAPHADALIDIAAGTTEPAVRSAVAQMLARVELSHERAEHGMQILRGYLDGGSDFVQGWALSAIVAIANDHPPLRDDARRLVRERLDSEALGTRARLLLDQADSWP